MGRKSPYSLYNQQLSSFEDDAGAYDQVRVGNRGTSPNAESAGAITPRVLLCFKTDKSCRLPRTAH